MSIKQDEVCMAGMSSCAGTSKATAICNLHCQCRQAKHTLRRAHRKEPGNVSQLVGLQAMDEAVLLAEALLKQLLVGAVDVAEALAEMTIVAAVRTPQSLKSLSRSV